MKQKVIDADRLRTLENMRLDQMLKEHWEVQSATEQNEKGVTVPKYAYHERYKATSVILKISERRATMLGLNKQPVFTLATSEQVQQCSDTLADIMRKAKDDSSDPESPQEDPAGETDSSSLGSESFD
jgi:hypothetical protein